MNKLFYVFVLCMGLLHGCATDQHTLSIDFSADRSKIVISNIDEASVRYLRNNLTTDSSYRRLVSVLQTPGDEDTARMEVEWPGELTMQRDEVVFTPDRPFIKGHFYLVETMLNARFGGPKAVLRSEVGHKVRATSVLLQR